MTLTEDVSPTVVNNTPYNESQIIHQEKKREMPNRY